MVGAGMLLTFLFPELPFSFPTRREGRHGANAAFANCERHHKYPQVIGRSQAGPAILFDALFELEEAQAGPAPSFAVPPAATPAAARGRGWLPWGVAALFAIAAGALGLAWWRAASAPRPVIRSMVTLPPGDRIVLRPQPSLALSPDGSKLVYAGLRGGRLQLFLRRLDSFEATPISGTEDGAGAFFSPDVEWVGFVAGGKLKKAAISGGAALTLCDATSIRGASWGPDDTIIFGPIGTPGTGLSRVSANGGIPQVLTTPDQKSQESHRWPQFLPGGKAVLFSVWAGANPETNRLEVVSLDTGQRRSLLVGGTYGQYVPTGHIVYARASALFAVPFDPGRLEIAGRQFPVLEGLGADLGGYAQLALSPTGSLVYVPGAGRASERILVWVDRKGAASPVFQADGGRSSLHTSPLMAGCWL